MEDTNLPKFSIRDLSRQTKKVLKNLPCFITYNKRIIAKIEHVDIQNGAKMQDMPAPAEGGDRESIPADEAGELPSFSNEGQGAI